MCYDGYKNIESIVKEILERLGKEVDVKANLRTWRDREDIISGGESESYVKVKGLEYHFDKIRILGYHYNNNYYFSVEYSYFFSKPYGCYKKKENGKIINENEEVWKPYLLELYDMLDDLERNQKAGEYFFKNYGSLIPWKKFRSYSSEEETLNYIRELDITLIARQTVSYAISVLGDVDKYYKILDGTNCVYDSEAEVFIDGPWKDNLIEYMLEKKEEKEKRKKLGEEKEFSKSMQRLRSIRKN